MGRQACLELVAKKGIANDKKKVMRELGILKKIILLLI